MEAVAARKSLLRKCCRGIRDSLGGEFRARASLSICWRIEAWEVFQKSAVIAVYMPMKTEASLARLLRRADKQWVLPRIIPQENKRMIFHLYAKGRLVVHPFGMAEPAPDLPAVPPKAIDLALVPGLAFDKQGWRLGYGGGYYDRFLAAFSGVSVGIVFHDLLLEEVPHDGHDVAMNWIITEREIVRAAAK